MINRLTLRNQLKAALTAKLNAGQGVLGDGTNIAVSDSAEGVQLPEAAKGIWVGFGDTAIEYDTPDGDATHRDTLPDRMEITTTFTADIIGFNRDHSEAIAAAMPRAVADDLTNSSYIFRVTDISSSLREAVQADTPREVSCTILCVERRSLTS